MRYLLTTANRVYVAAIAAILLAPASADADGIVVGKIYDPYVQPLEQELEWRALNQADDRVADLQKHSLGVGRSISDRWAFEVYAIAQKGSGESLSFDSYELELKWQLTEQGEYAVDWGLLFELEREVENNTWEFASSVL
ncbi:MAG: hypothetical protein WBM34_16200, partial [Woeseiaceae bacterium]